jgi:hypothetical protein
MNHQQLGNVQTHVLIQKLARRLYFTQKTNHFKKLKPIMAF